MLASTDAIHPSLLFSYLLLLCFFHLSMNPPSCINPQNLQGQLLNLLSCIKGGRWCRLRGGQTVKMWLRLLKGCIHVIVAPIGQSGTYCVCVCACVCVYMCVQYACLRLINLRSASMPSRRNREHT